MNALVNFFHVVGTLNLSPIALGSLVLVGVIAVLSITIFKIQVQLSTPRGWYHTRCRILTERHGLNMGESRFLRKIRKPSVSAFKLLTADK